jgi:hypothetical protein
MSRKDKLIDRLLSMPRDFTWEELSKVLAQFGYTELKNGKTGGSRRKFANAAKDVISFHKPHPANIVKHYAISDLVDFLRNRGYIKNE